MPRSEFGLLVSYKTASSTSLAQLPLFALFERLLSVFELLLCLLKYCSRLT